MFRTLLAPWMHHPIITLDGHGPVYWAPIGTIEVYG